MKCAGTTAALASVGALTTDSAGAATKAPSLTELSATKLAAMIADGQVSAEEVAEAHLKRIEEVNPNLNAIVQMNAEQVRSGARQADKELRKGVSRGPLHGVPFTIKDCISTKGIITTNGCPELREYIPKIDATVVKRLKKAGGILLGKTNVPEMCFGDTDNLVYGPTLNPYSHEHGPGGSSGGEAAIIAAGGSPFGIGTDIGGSIRSPAHCCGIAGLKPTNRLVPESGILSTFPLEVGGWNSVGPLARHAEDLYTVLQVIAGPDNVDSQTVPVPLHSPSSVAVERLRVAFFTDDGTSTPTAETLESVKRAVRALEASGVALVKEDRPPAISQAASLWIRAVIPQWATAMRYWQLEYATMGEADISEKRSPLTEFIFESLDMAYQNGNYGPDQKERNQRELHAFRAQMLQFFSSYDVLLSPVEAKPAAKLMTVDEVAQLPKRRFIPLLSEAMGGFYVTHNMTGWPAAVVRAGTSPEGLPIGVQIAAKPWHDHVAIAVAKLIEEELGGWQAPTGV
ncbi:amidase [Novipirellula artificiosorum]|uniref:Acylamidase n=1 Tax=Novipirellula artificiosorum TaxID=2528016 RepID=A0A5C6DDR1_9BACT|nr:amidase [Novipirellula artificiosorum]TWU34848.1 Acylamidase [Novipirellula artificiosorum]